MEASLLLHDSYKKKTEMIEKKGKEVRIGKVFFDFLSYIDRLPNVPHIQDGDGDDIDELKDRLKKTQKATSEIEGFKDITKIEQVKLLNLAPQSVEEAVAWIPSLDRFQVSGREIYLKNVLDTVRKHTPIDPLG